MTSVQQGTLRVPGALLFYRSCGRGAPLLILAGGDADADMTDPLRDVLATNYRVITYDRRGLSRSTILPDGAQPGIETHADDAHRLLAELTDEPAYVFGSGIGGFVGLDLLARYPEQVRLLVAHEAPSAELLPEEDEAVVRQAQQAMHEAFQNEGAPAALKLSAELAGIDTEDREPDLPAPVMNPHRDKNTLFLLSSDAPLVMAYRIDLPALDVQARKIVPAAGRSTRRTLLHQCAAALAEILELPLVEFPGGHTGWLLKPRAFATQLAETFAAADRPDRAAADIVSHWSGGRA
jgi:pimeloyl-ACP methyl ester carboxylesterase